MSAYSITPAVLTAGGLLGANTVGAGQPKLSADLSRPAKEFESILLSQWLQSAETSFGSVPGSQDDSDAGDEQMKSFGVQALAKSFSEAGGIGIAKSVNEALQKSEASSPVPKPESSSAP